MIGKGGCYGKQIQEIGSMSANGDLEDLVRNGESLRRQRVYVDVVTWDSFYYFWQTTKKILGLGDQWRDEWRNQETNNGKKRKDD